MNLDLKSALKQNWLFTLLLHIVLMWTNNLYKLIRSKQLFVLVIFNQNLNIYFRSGMTFILWWRQFDCLGRTSLNTPLNEWETEEVQK